MQQVLADAPADQPVTVNIVRMVFPGKEADFENLVRAFVPQALTHPGHLGVHVTRPASTARDYHIVIKFATREQWRQFQEWPAYQEFLAAIEPLLEREPCIEEMSGLESWLTLPHAHALRPLPRWKMAMVTLLGVYPTSLMISVFIRPWLTDWSHWLQILAVSACMVAILTWVVMPMLTQLFASWLYPPAIAKRHNGRECEP